MGTLNNGLMDYITGVVVFLVQYRTFKKSAMAKKVSGFSAFFLAVVYSVAFDFCAVESPS